MAPPVWILSVDLQTKTATFQTGLSDAAKAARGSFNDIKRGANEMGGSVGYSMGEARHSVMLLGEEFGVHLPRALTTFIAGLGPIGPALEAAFPFLAIAVGATLLISHLVKMREEGARLTDDQVRFGTAVDNAFNSLDQKIIQAQIRADELRNDHLGALKLQLELIDKQSMAELVHAFEEVAKAADVVMKDLDGHWYTFGIGSEGAKHALDEFQVKYNSLLAQGKEEEATGLLKGTLQQAQKTRDMMQQFKAEQSTGQSGNYQKFEEASEYLKQRGLLSKITGEFTKGELESQDALVNALQAQVGLEGRIGTLKSLDKGNAKSSEGNEEAGKSAAAARQAAESKLRLGEETIAADRATADALLTIHRASLEQRLDSDIAFAGRDRELKLAANASEIAALDKNGKDYANQLKALEEKNSEIHQEYDTKTAELRAKASVDTNARDLRDLEQSEREKIEATKQGSAARLAAIDTAIKDEESRNLQDTSFYRELLNTRVEAARQEAEEEARLKAEAAHEEADNDEKMGQLTIAAEKQHMALLDSTRRASINQRIAEDTRVANEEYEMKLKALDKEIQGLDKAGKDYQNKLKQLQDKETQLEKQHQNELTAIKEKAEQDRNQRILSAMTQFEDSIAAGMTRSIMGKQSWTKTMLNLGDQMVAGAIQNAIKSALAEDFGKEKTAAKAARAGFVSGMKLPFPANIVAAPVMAAGAFAAVMAFATGTDSVPGMGRTDSVPTMLTPGEGVVPGGVMDGLRNMARNGGFENSRSNVTLHMRPTYHVNTIDGDGMQAALEKHTEQLQGHFEQVLRKANR